MTRSKVGKTEKRSSCPSPQEVEKNTPLTLSFESPWVPSPWHSAKHIQSRSSLPSSSSLGTPPHAHPRVHLTDPLGSFKSSQANNEDTLSWGAGGRRERAWPESPEPSVPAPPHCWETCHNPRLSFFRSDTSTQAFRPLLCHY